MTGRAARPGSSAIADALAALVPPPVRAGVPLGRTADGQLIGLDLGRETPTRIALITDLGLAKLVALRALSAGLVVAISTGRIHQWLPLCAAAELATDRLHISELAGPAPLPLANLTRPVVHFHDSGVAPPDPPAPRVAFHSVVHVLPGVHPHAAALLRSCTPVIVAGLQPTPARALTDLLELAPAWARALTALTARQLLVLGSPERPPITVTVSAGRTELGV